MSNYYNFPIGIFKNINETTVSSNFKEILMNDENLKLTHLANPARFTEFHINRGSDCLLLVIGESWAYGEGFPGIGTAQNKFDFNQQIKNCFSSRIIEATGWDLYQYAVPGNCNLYMFVELDRILEYISKLNYKKVYVVIQLTENTREFPLLNDKIFTSYKPINDWFRSAYDNEISVIDWLAKYDEMFFDHFNNSLANFKACPIEGVLWRNFTKSASLKRNYNFKFIEKTWIEYTASLINLELNCPFFVNAYGIELYKKDYGKKLITDFNFMDEQLNLIKSMYDYIGGISNPGVIYHNNHPSKFGHLVWAHYILRQTGWKNI